MPPLEWVTRLLHQPELGPELTPQQWDLVIRRSRHAEVQGQLYARIAAAGCLENIPEAPRAHLENSWRLSQRHRLSVRWELLEIAETLRPLNIPVVLLKGAAYHARGLKAAEGRLFSDIDILVPRSEIEKVEKTFYLSGWVGTHTSAYDQAYYRRWMHEIPPIQHLRRGTLVDIHHTLLPPTSGVACSGDDLIAAAVGLEDAELAFYKVLTPTDMLLHAATHLYYGEFNRALRELVDLDNLLDELGREQGFWDQVEQRAEELDLLAPLHFSLGYCQEILGTHVPPEILGRATASGRAGCRKWPMHSLFQEAFLPDHPTCNSPFTHLSRQALYVRSHWLRMPLHLLVRHLFHKAFIAPKQDSYDTA